MGFTLRNQKYNWTHLYIIPFQCSPLATVGVWVQKLMTAFTAVFQLPVTAKLLDTAIKAAQNQVPLTDIYPWFFLLLVLAGYRRVAINIGSVFSKKSSIDGEYNLSVEYTNKRAKLKFHYIEDTETWNLINRVCNKVRFQVQSMLQFSCNLVLFTIRIVGVLIVIQTQIWWLAPIILIMVIPLVLFSSKSGRKSYKIIKTASEHERMYRYLGDVLTGRGAVDERTLFGFSATLNQYWYEQFEISRKINLKATIFQTISVRASSALTTIISSVVILLLIKPAVTGVISVGMFIALATGVYDLINLMGGEFMRAISNVTKALEYLNDVSAFAALEETEGALDKPATDQSSFSFEKLEFKNVSFKYPNTNTYILKNMDMVLQKGFHYAFVGANGAGKTTITKLITGLYDNYEGEILINNKNLKNYTQAELKSIFTGVYQDFAKYQITIKQNMLLGNINELENSQHEERMKEISKKLEIYDKINSFSNGFDTPLGKIEKDGVDISGGQWQRIAMARTILSPSPVQILDEPTAALDPISESKLYEQFESMCKGKTTIFISHRLGSTKIANKIFVLDGGSVVEQGTHEALMSLHGKYAEMYDSQRSWYQ